MVIRELLQAELARRFEAGEAVDAAEVAAISAGIVARMRRRLYS
jgi:hypothetical protein